ncbi:MAG: tripartite tricarboxylate transporter TctB family protein [Limnochordia bacterium]|jgi:hypothetical protein|nr:tripartite tricarboxylate transporter TctB family protein [Limnochordia bacterium]MDI9464969.1 tripartite tricarboxylate transporter TctB family protein [Bacillota bacterium]NLO94427.1 tripartite tricarboxylate transporter TctB family protein [Bacillota bacterium]HAN94174.1 hypothetical protein [Bacillota bacterium]HOB41142.1 tripartite tricarboxylate transporter TctB family protein [Limnochordia bacterium]
MKVLRQNDFWLGVGLSVFSIWYLVVAGQIRRGATHPVDVGPRALPLIYGSLLLILSIALIIRTILEARKTAEEGESAGLPLKSVVTAGLAVAYAWLIPRLGFVLSSTALLLCTTRVIANKKYNYWLLTLTYLVLSLALSFIFSRWFYVQFPEPLLDALGV